MPPHENPHHARRWAILAVLGIAQLMVVLDATIVNIALPSAQRDLAFSNDSRQWIVTAYALAFGSLLLLGGRIGDLFGRKRTFIAGLIGFAVASAIGGAAGSFGVLVAARAAQGLFGALLAPAALGLLTTTFTDPSERAKAFGIYGAIAGGGAAVGLLTTTFTDPGERAKAFGIFGAIAGGGAAIGLLLGGLLTEYASWRWCLYVNLLFAIPAAVVAFSLLHNVVPAHRPKLDVPGTLTASTGLFALVYGFSHAETTSWGDALTVGMLAASAVLLVSFVLIQMRSKNPLLPLRIVLDRGRGGAYLAMGLAGAGMFGVFLFLTFYLQNTLGFSPIQSGLAFLPMSAAIIATATTATTRLVPRLGAKPLVMTGMAFAAVAMAFFAQLEVDSSYALHILPGLVLLGVGLGLVFAPAFSTATVGVGHSDAGVASAMVNTSQQVGGSIGTALLSTLAGSAVTSYAVDHGTSQAAMAAAAVHGYTTAFYWSAAIFALGAIASAIVLRSGVPQAATAPAAEPVLAH